jgi:hypothetical protein
VHLTTELARHSAESQFTTSEFFQASINFLRIFCAGALSVSRIKMQELAELEVMGGIGPNSPPDYAGLGCWE